MKKLKTILQSNIFYIIVIIILTFYIIFFTIIKQYNINDFNNEIIGIVTDLKVNENNISFIIKDKNIKCIYYLDNPKEYEYLLGKTVNITGEYKNILNNTIPNTFNYKKYLYNNKIYANFIIQDIKIIKDENILYKIKNKIIKRINNYSNKEKTYLNLFILGDKNYLDNELYNVYQNNGIWHLFAISGMHIGLIILILSKLLKRIKYKNIIISIFLFFFMFLTSFSASVLRAVIFFFISALFKFLKINITNIKILLLDAFIILFINPFMIYNTGFQYSFIITFSIMYLSHIITGNKITKILKISIISFIVSLPITININYEINILSMFLNIIYVPFISCILFPISIISFLFKLITPIFSILINILEYTNNLFNKISLNLIIPKLNFIEIIIYYIFLIIFYKNKKLLISFLISFILIMKLIPKIDNNYYVYYLDVGQGDSNILISPHKKETIMIDTGGNANSNYHISNNTILFLKSLGINHIDLLIITHGDTDHAKEAINIIKKYQVNNIVLNKNNINKIEKEILNNKNSKNTFNSKYFNYKLINDYISNDENYSSIISYFQINNYNFLFMGDVPSEVEEKLIKDYKIEVDFLKLGHHGSKTSSSQLFLNNFNNYYAIISSGRNNLYHHPSKEVIDRLNYLNIPYLNTQDSGTIEVKINNMQYKIKTYKP